jgi:hypothetical protein
VLDTYKEIGLEVNPNSTEEIGPEVNIKKMKYIVVSHQQNVGHRRNLMTATKPFEDVEKFKYLGTNVTDRNFVQEEIKSRLNSGSVCHHSVYTVFCLPVSFLKT